MKHKRMRSLLLLSAIVFLPGTTQTANAFWNGVGKWSGPGPFWGFDVIIPFTFNSAERQDVHLTNRNRDVLNRFFLTTPAPPLTSELRSTLSSPDQKRYYAQILQDPRFERLDPMRKRRGSNVWLDFLEIVAPQRYAESKRRRDGAGTTLTANQALSFERAEREEAEILFEERVLRLAADKRTREVQRRLRTFGLSQAGFFNSQAAIPALADVDGKNTVRNLFLTVAPGYSQSWKNDLSYSPENDADKTVRWATLYGALEYRWAQTADYSKNLFANVGPAYHYIFSDAFENLSRWSVRGRFGFRYHSLSFGGQIDFFTESVSHERLGAVGDPESHRFGYAFFLGVELPGLTHVPQISGSCKKKTC